MPAKAGAPDDIEARWAAWACLALLAAEVIFLIWAADHGLDRRDDAFYLLAVANPAFPSVSDFAHVWRPLFLLTGGSLAAMRLGGMTLSLICAAAFGWSLTGFAPVRGGAGRIAVVAAITACVFWQYDLWQPTANYNGLNLAGLTLFFSGLLRASTAPATDAPRSGLVLNSALAAIGLVLMALAKPTTAAAVLGLGLAWLVLARPARPFAHVAATALFALVLFGLCVFAFHGGPGAYVAELRQAVAWVGAMDDRPGGDLHGIGGAFVRPLGAAQRFKVWQILPFGLGLLAAGLVWAWATVSRTDDRPRRLAAYGALVVLVVATAMARALDVWGAGASRGLHVWYFALSGAFAALALAAAWRWMRNRQPLDRARLAAVVVLALAPVAYSFGTDLVLVLHAAGAGIFWAAAMIVLTADGARRPALALNATAVLCAASSLALLAGIAVNPGRAGPSLWNQTTPVTVGYPATTVRLDAESARYFQAFQSTARDAGFVPGMPLVDLAHEGPGLVLALGGRPPISPWLMETGEGGFAMARAVLRDLPTDRLAQAWILTGKASSVADAASVLTERGLDFPGEYQKVTSQTHGRTGVSETLWKPRAPAASLPPAPASHIVASPGAGA